MISRAIDDALEVSRAVEDKFRSRELALVITKLEEASHWVEALRRKQAAQDTADAEGEKT